MTGDTTAAMRADQGSRTRKVIAVATSVGLLACAALGVRMLFTATATRADQSAWQSVPTVAGAVVVAELPGEHSDDGYDFWVRQVEVPGLSGSQVTAAYTTELTRAGWQLLESYPAEDGSGFSRVCLANGDGGDPRLADIRTRPASDAHLDRVEIAVSRQPGDRSSCGAVFGQFTWPEAAKPAG